MRSILKAGLLHSDKKDTVCNTGNTDIHEPSSENVHYKLIPFYLAISKVLKYCNVFQEYLSRKLNSMNLFEYADNII